jgi:aminoglycoside phosphotransferase (APT) family kinase protein
MAAGPGQAVLGWVAGVLGTGRPEVVRGLRDGASPWLLRAGGREVVLRVGTSASRHELATEATALQLAAGFGVPGPELLGSDDGGAAGVPLVLSARLPGNSQIPREPDPARLSALGRQAARLHAITLDPSPLLPARDRPIAVEDWAAMRRSQPPRELLAAAEAAVARDARPCERPVFVHGDLWQGNVLWQGTTVTGLLDWDCAGAGDPGVDLGSLRCDAALCYGAQAPAHVLRGWQEQAGRPADRVAYWDMVAALSSPPDMGWFPLSMALQGRPDLDRPTMLARRDEFLRQALEALGASP